MRLSGLIRADREYKSFSLTLGEALRATEPLPIVVNGLTGGAELAFLAEAIRDARKLSSAPALVLVRDDSEREKVLAALSASGLSALGFKKRDLVFHNIKASHDIDRERLSVLSAVMSGEADAVVTTPSAAAVYTLPEELLLSLTVGFAVGDVLPPEELSERLVTLGFARMEVVDGRGQFSRRGGIVDFWGGESEYPIRVEFFGDDIDRMVYFDPISQRSVGECEGARLLPAMEVMVGTAARARMLLAVNELIKSADGEVRDRLRREAAVLSSDSPIDFADKYLGIVYESRASLFSYLKTYPRVAIFTLGTSACLDDIKRQEDYFADERQALLSMNAVTEAAAEYTAGVADYESFLAENITVHLNPFAGGVRESRLFGLFGFRCRRTVAYGGNPTMLYEDLSSFRKGLYRTVIVTDTRQGRDSLVSTLADADIATIPLDPESDVDVTAAEGGKIFVTVGSTEGYDLISPKIAVISMARDEGRAVMQNRRRQRILRQSGGAGKRLMSYADLSVGDYVVHANYGIGLFEGIETVTVDGVTRDYITIKYAGTDKLFVPCDRLEMIGKYIGERDKDGKVKLSKMGGGDWTRTKSRAKSAARDIAKNLIQLYAERQRKPGFAFPEDSDLEDSFADSFEYEETESQTVAIREIKADMMRPVPMNRLLCGDVGFGKTEVALRAAFKCISEGKQCAILVPTTILAWQHYNTILKRLGEFPVEVRMLSRFVTPKQQQKTVLGLKRGNIDLVVGTHRLISKDVVFKDLGLVIIDEEQRFGVAQKERLKETYPTVDVLTLSATPIPRTLNMAMSGLRDLSSIDEAPSDRHPVQTYVLEQNNGVLIEAIRKELRRGGQVYYLHNRVDTIERTALRLKEHLPEASVATAHGKMGEEELSDVWKRLLEHEIDILVCTTIIETGVDVPNANTLIIEDADRFGLSQLHQLRGRVGRSPRRAYAYFCYRMGKGLSEIATKRLNAIREYTEFGSGFKIAMRDLEIRGAGSILGGEQHGNMEAVGYDMYLKLLNSAMREEKGEQAVAETECLVDLNISAHIPENYIESVPARLGIYRRIAEIKNSEDASDVIDELCDRFGEPPKSVMGLIDIALFRSRAADNGIYEITGTANTLNLKITEIKEEQVAKICDGLKGRAFLVPTENPYYTIKMLKGQSPAEALKELAELL